MKDSINSPDMGLTSTLVSDATTPGFSTRDGLSKTGKKRQTVGRYSILEKIGEGGMGVVYSAYDPALDRRVAVKVVSFETRNDPAENSRTRLQREARALAQLNHPNVVVVHEVGESDGHLFIAMEFIEGQTVRDWVRDQERSAHEVIDLFCDAGRCRRPRAS